MPKTIIPVYLEVELKNRFKMKCAKEDLKMSAEIVKYIKRIVENKEKLNQN